MITVNVEDVNEPATVSFAEGFVESISEDDYDPAFKTFVAEIVIDDIPTSVGLISENFSKIFCGFFLII